MVVITPLLYARKHAAVNLAAGAVCGQDFWQA